MARTLRRTVVVLLAVLFCMGDSGCTSVEQGFQDGLSSGVAAALAAIIEMPVTNALNESLNEGQE